MEGTSRSPQGDVIIEITKESTRLVSSLKEKMQKVSVSPCIFRVPETLSKQNEDKYFPTLVSIGPFHHIRQNSKAYQDQKWRYLNTLFARAPNVDSNLENCVKSLKETESKARKFYSEEIEISSEEFVEMMLVDGCFIIELFLHSSVKGLRRRDDPFFSTIETAHRLKCDLILLENQIPFFVLQQLFNLVPLPKQLNQSLIQIALHFFRRMIQGELQVLQDRFSQEFKHLLDLIHQCHLPTYPESKSSGRQTNLQSATNIQKAGIRMKKNKTDMSLLDIKFSKQVLEIPILKIHNYTEILLRNLIAMEINSHNCTKKVTSYVLLMNGLIRSKEDLRLLHKRGIVAEGFEREEEIVDMFKKMCVEMNVKEFYYRGICEDVNGYGKNELRVMKRKVEHVYRKTPLGFAVHVVAVLVLVLAFTGVLVLVVSFSLHHHF